MSGLRLLTFSLLLLSIATEIGGIQWDCQRAWPSLELFLPLFVNPLQEQQQQKQWHRVFLSSFITFWPLNISRTSVRFVAPEEKRYTRVYREFRSLLLEHYASKLSWDGREGGGQGFELSLTPPLINVMTSGDATFNNSEHIRTQLLMFFADNYTSEKHDYIGFVEADTMFVNYVDREDIFEDGKPVIHGRVGMDPRHQYHNNLASTSGFWLLGGSKYPEPMRCRNYYPFVIKRSHLRDMRSFIFQTHNSHDSIYGVFEEYIALFNGHLSHQFNVMCTYLWYFKRDEYKWYVHEFNEEWTDRNGNGSGNGNDTLTMNVSSLSSNKAREDSLKKEIDVSFAAKPMIAISSSHHYRKMLDKIAFEGYCLSPPFPKLHGDENRTCYALTGSMQNDSYIYIKDMHSYGDATYFMSENISDAIVEHKKRYDRIKNCNNTKYDPEILLSMISKVDMQGLPMMREFACQNLVKKYSLHQESDIHLLPRPTQEKYKIYNCYSFYLETLFKSNEAGSIDINFAMRRQERKRYQELRSNISFFQLLASCPEGMAGIGKNCTCTDDPTRKGCAYSTLRTFLPPSKVIEEQMQRKSLDILFSKSFNHFLLTRGNFGEDKREIFPYHNSKPDLDKLSIGRFLRYNSVIAYNRLGPETVLAASGTEEAKSWSIYNVDYPYVDFRWGWSIEECKSSNKGWLCGFQSISEKENETTLDDFVRSRLVHSSDFIEVLESRLTSPNNIVQMILFGKMISMLSRPSNNVKMYINNHLMSSKKGKLPTFADTEEALEDEEEEKEEISIEEKQDFSVKGEDEDSNDKAPTVSMHVRHGDACDLFLNSSVDDLAVSTNTDDDNWSRICFQSSVYMEKLQLVQKKYGVKKVFLSTDSSDMIKLAAEHPEFEWVYLDIPRAAFDMYVKSGLDHHMNEQDNQANNTIFFFSAVADMEILKRGDIFIGTFASHFSKNLYSAMVGYQMRMIPFISLDFPIACDTVDYCSDAAILSRRQTIEEIVLRGPSCERVNGKKM